MKSLADPGKHLEEANVEQVAALALGSRIAMDSWSDKITLLRGPTAHPVSPSQKMPFEVSAFFPYLKRLDANPPAAAAPAPVTPPAPAPN